jgi:hypothetical protein
MASRDGKTPPEPAHIEGVRAYCGEVHFDLGTQELLLAEELLLDAAQAELSECKLQ